MKIAFSFCLVIFSNLAVAAPKNVPIFFIEALDPKDTTSSQRFETEYKSAIEQGQKSAAKRLNDCGYKLQTTSYFYGASDPLQAKEQAERAQKEGAWLIIGPRRSNHYLVLAKGAVDTPSVSIMASSAEVAELAPLHLSMSPTNATLAKAGAQAIRDRLPRKAQGSYVSVVNSECITCKDFAKSFDDGASAVGLRKRTEIFVTGEQPDLKNVFAELAEVKPDFVLLPNYSILTGYLISEIHSKFSNVFFVGGDGWGDSNFGFVQNGRDLKTAEGITVRGFPPFAIGATRFSIGKELMLGASAIQLESTSALAILKIFDSTAALLCESRPQDFTSFRAAFLKKGNEYYSAPWGVSVYKLNQGKIEFEKSLEAH